MENPNNNKEIKRLFDYMKTHKFEIDQILPSTVYLSLDDEIAIVTDGGDQEFIFKRPFFCEKCEWMEGDPARFCKSLIHHGTMLKPEDQPKINLLTEISSLMDSLNDEIGGVFHGIEHNGSRPYHLELYESGVMVFTIWPCDVNLEILKKSQEVFDRHNLQATSIRRHTDKVTIQIIDKGGT